MLHRLFGLLGQSNVERRSLLCLSAGNLWRGLSVNSSALPEQGLSELLAAAVDLWVQRELRLTFGAAR
jgi:uncharacterized membrane protein